MICGANLPLGNDFLRRSHRLKDVFMSSSRLPLPTARWTRQTSWHERSRRTQASRASPIPGPEEDREVAHSAYLHAFQEAQPEKARVPGMQEFASAILARSRIPSQQYSDPLLHIFQEFDTNNDGCLTASEVGQALRSRDVHVTDEQVEMFIDAVDLTHSHTVQASEFRDLVLHMAAADLHSRKSQFEGEWVRCSLESDDEIQEKLKSWIDHLMTRRYR